MPIRKQEIPIFPRPTTPDPIKRRDLFGSRLLRDRNGNDQLELDLDLLRAEAANMLTAMGLASSLAIDGAFMSRNEHCEAESSWMALSRFQRKIDFINSGTKECCQSMLSSGIPSSTNG